MMYYPTCNLCLQLFRDAEARYKQCIAVLVESHLAPHLAQSTFAKVNKVLAKCSDTTCECIITALLWLLFTLWEKIFGSHLWCFRFAYTCCGMVSIQLQLIGFLGFVNLADANEQNHYDELQEGMWVYSNMVYASYISYGSIIVIIGHRNRSMHSKNISCNAYLWCRILCEWNANGIDRFVRWLKRRKGRLDQSCSSLE